MEAVQTIDLTKRYRDTVAVDRLNLSVRQGELFALLGVNGAGKTTAIRLLSCLARPDAGDALIEGKSVCREAAAVRELIALSPQETAVAPNLSVRENLELMAGAHGFSRKEARIKTGEALARFGLSGIAKRRAGKLSGGWQRRLSIAMALLSEPHVLFLDEPTLGLDVLARSELLDFIRAMKGKITVILTTHYLEEAEALADRVGIMKAGRLLEIGTVDEIKARAGADRLDEAFLRIVKEENA